MSNYLLKETKHWNLIIDMEIEIVKHVRNPRDLATIFSADDKFLGVFECDEYKLTRKFIEGKGVSMRLYYNHMEPTT